ncbi:nucleotidyltransferase domain-containing protein [Frondihabitans cladoniiphilus]|uniref:Adenylyltransferase AadA C-terminal domain-containing protein n=1 Tax=Frondihabitans cladoniiphilus TaxID=715785 RepID=A0ABP8VNY9_9MICO
MNAPGLPEPVARRLDSFARDHRRIAPDALTRLLVTGSAIAGDWWPGTSDIDVVFVVDRPLTETELDTLRILHAETIPDGPIDGIYLTEEQLAGPPDDLGAAIQVVEGKLTPDLPGSQLTWITWREMETGVETEVTDTGIHAWSASRRRWRGSVEGSQGFSRQNLLDYWAPLGSSAREQLKARQDDVPVAASSVVWLALGPPRLLVTITTGEIVSKSAAATFAANRWPEFSDLLLRAVASRAGDQITFTAGDARSAVALLEKCVAAAAPPEHRRLADTLDG